MDKYFLSKKAVFAHYLSTFSKLGGTLTSFFVYSFFMEFLNELWRSKPAAVIELGFAILVLLGIYIKLLDIYNL